MKSNWTLFNEKKTLISKAIDVSQEYREQWERVPLNDKIKCFLNAADLVSDKYRYDLNATTMLGNIKKTIDRLSNYFYLYNNYLPFFFTFH